MNPLDEFDEDGTPRAEVWRRQHAERMAQRNFVAPMPAPLVRREPTTIDQAPQWLAPAQPLDVGHIWQPGQGARETTSAVDRARGLQMRVLPFVGLYALAGVVVGVGVWLAAGSVPLAALLAVLVFAGMGTATYAKLNLQDYQHSGAGVERHRIDSATYLAERELDHKARMQEKALDAYLRQMEGRNR